MMMRLLVLFIAVLLDLLLGDPPNRWHPVVWMGNFIRWFSSKAPRGNARRFLWGLRLVFAGVCLFSIPIFFLEKLTVFNPVVGLVLQVILLKTVFSLRGLLCAGAEIEKALQAGELAEARRLLSRHLVSRPTAELSEGQVASATIESLSENLVDSIIAPWLFYLLGGLPLVWAYRFVNTADAMIGYRDPLHEYLGKFAARLDDVLNWIPARLTGFLLLLAAPFMGASLPNAWRTMLRDQGQVASPNAGWPMTAAAGVLGVLLEKPGHYRLAGAEQYPLAADIQKCRRLVAVCVILFFLAGGIVIIFIPGCR